MIGMDAAYVNLRGFPATFSVDHTLGGYSRPRAKYAQHGEQRCPARLAG
jgi:hypothetical protein